MAWVHAPQYLWSGTTTDPRELMGNIFELAREINGYVDRDNLGENVVTSAKVATGAFNTLGSTEFSSSTDSISIGETGAWEEITSLSTTVTTEDGRILAESFFAYYQSTSAGLEQNTIECRMLIDGNVVDETGWISAYRRAGTVYMAGSSSVAAGSHAITVQWRTRPHAWVYLDQIEDGTFPSAAAVAGNIGVWDVLNGALTYRHQKR